MEEGLSETRQQLLSAEKQDGNDGSNRDADSSATIMLVLSTFIAGCGSFTNGCTTGYSSPAESGIRDDLGLSTAEYALFGSILTIGGVIGSLFCGQITDFLGRKRTMGFINIMFVSGWLLIAFAETTWELDLGRLLTGVGSAISYYATTVYVAEITPKNLRGVFTSFPTFVLTLGFSSMFFLGSYISWRILALIGSIGSFIQIVGLFFIPESPRWLAKIGRDDFEDSLRRLRGEHADISQEATDIREFTRTFEEISKSSFFDLFERRYAHALIVGVGLMILPQFAGTNSTTYYVDDIFDLAGFSSSIGSEVIAIIQIPLTLLSVLLMDKAGRKPLLLVSAAGLALANFLMGLAFLVQGYYIGTKITPILTFIGIMFYNIFGPVGIASIPWLIMSEIFPVQVKGLAGSLVTLSNWSFSWVATYTFPFLLDWSATGLFFIYTAFSCLTILFIVLVVPETKLQTLEEIQASMNHFM